MNFHTLRYILTVSEEKSITKAAKKLFISQPSLSQSIQNAEKKLGTKLFTRENGQIVTTYAGAIYTEWARQMLQSESEILRKLSDISENNQRKLVISVSPHRSIGVLSEVLDRFYSQVHGCTIILEEHTLSDSVALLEDGRVDLLVDLPQADTINYTSIPIMEEKILLAAPDTIGFNCLSDEKYPKISLDEVLEKPFILLESTQYLGQVARNVLSHGNTRPEAIMECYSIEIAHNMVSKGLGVTLIPEFSIRPERAFSNVRYYTIASHELTRMMSVVYRNDRYLSKDAQTFAQIMQTFFKK